MKFYIIPFIALILTLSGCSASKPFTKDVLSISATSTLQSSNDLYEPANLIDKTTLTWVEGVKGDGIGESVTFTFAKKVTVKHFFIKNGYGVRTFFKLNNRVKSLEVSSEKGDKTTVTLQDTPKISEVILKETVTGKKITFTIRSVYKGVKYHDTCIAEILFTPPPAAKPIRIGFGGEKCGYFDKLHGVVIPEKFQVCLPFDKGLAIVKQDDKFGFINKKGDFVISPKYSYARNFSEGLSLVCIDKDDKHDHFFIDRKGNRVCTVNKAPFQNSPGYPSDFISDFKNGIASVQIEDDHTGESVAVEYYFNTKGEEVKQPLRKANKNEYLLLSNKEDDYFNASNVPVKFWFVNDQGVNEFKRIFPFARSFSEGLAAVQTRRNDNKTWCYINTKGKITLRLRLKNIISLGDLSEGLAVARVKRGDGIQWGFINKKGKMVIKPQFEKVYDFSEGLSAVCVKQGNVIKWGFIDIKGKMVIKPQFQVANSFTNGKATVKISDKKYAIINTKGEILLKLPYDVFDYSFSEGLMVVGNRLDIYNNYKYGYINKKGKIAIPLKYGEATNFNNGIAFVAQKRTDIGCKLFSYYIYKNCGYIDKKERYLWFEKGYNH